MTSHQIAIAKASFSAGLLRPDPVSVSRDDISCFHDALDTMLSHCSPIHIQNCKSWLLKNVVPSTTRLGGLGKFLVALAESFHTPEPEKSGRRTGRTSSKRKRLHTLYLINDLLHHVKYHGQTSVSFPSVAESLRSYIAELFSLAATFDLQRNPKHHKRLRGLLDIWGSSGYYNADHIKQLHAAVENPRLGSNTPSGPLNLAEGGKKIAARDVPFTMPSIHGDPNAQYHDLPAGNLLPHIIPNSSNPIRSQSVKALQFAAGPADENLVNAVKSLLKEVDQIYDANGSEPQNLDIVDVDELGQITRRNPVTGGLVEEDTYYGWSRSFCQNMKQRRSGKAPSSSSSRTASPNGRPLFSKRRRYSYSGSDDERGRSQTRSRSRSRGSSSQRDRRRDSYSPRSRSPRPQRRMRSRSRSNSYSPPVPQQNVFQPQQHQQTQPSFPPAHNPVPMQFGYGQPPNMPPQQAGPVGAFPPPPKPPNYHGPWPPPPPSPFPSPGAAAPFMPMPMNMNMPGLPQTFSPNPMGGQQYFPPPPLPPPHHHHHQQQQQQQQQPPNLPFNSQHSHLHGQHQHQQPHGRGGGGWNQGWS